MHCHLPNKTPVTGYVFYTPLIPIIAFSIISFGVFGLVKCVNYPIFPIYFQNISESQANWEILVSIARGSPTLIIFTSLVYTFIDEKRGFEAFSGVLCGGYHWFWGNYWLLRMDFSIKKKRVFNISDWVMILSPKWER